MSDQLRDAARRVVEKVDDLIRRAERAKYTEGLSDLDELSDLSHALRAALTETGEADPYPRYYRFDDVMWKWESPTTGAWRRSVKMWEPIQVHRSEADMLEHHKRMGYATVRTDADGNRLEGR